MNPTRHTPGPWSVETPCEGFSIVEDGKSPAEWRFIAQVHDDKENGIPPLEAEANAELIASAPKLFSAVADCYMMARRQAARLKRENSSDDKTIEAWNHVIRFCEGTGRKSSILRESVPTDMQGG